ncbi:Polygalacturonase [Hibiscus syriacus]|uniref:Polygalacturonase n=1 Tax=Hibiscus syriacus TaxID=106335 RepID=A0A6A3BEJ8_HIBSY|nr:Polygalacturonase [Hibiscus syriacus]
MLGINSTSATQNYNVLNFGAKPNGKTDSTKAFLMARQAACGSADSTLIYVPKGRYLLDSMTFRGICKSPRITFRIDGTLVAPLDYRVLGKSTDWISFQGVNGVSIVGGALDAKGSSLWACKHSHTNCPSGATNLWIQVICGPGHGISNGSLAKDLKEEGVQNVTVKKTIFVGTQNGLRIKSWARPSTGFVQRVRFMDSLMVHVQNPIVIDQNYCPHNLNCPHDQRQLEIQVDH